MDNFFENNSTLVDLLALRAELTPNKVAFTFLNQSLEESEQITFSQLHERAKVIASELQKLKIENPTALLLYPQNMEHMCSLWFCMYAGVRAVPLFLPRNDRVYKRIRSIQIDCGAQIVMCDSDSYQTMSDRMDRMTELRDSHWLISDQIEGTSSEEYCPVNPCGDRVAYYQYTSGSTGNPKGVMVSHKNLMCNLSDIENIWEHTQDSVLVSWLPIFHDLGLICGFLQGVYTGFHSVLLNPHIFAQRPYSWLKAASDYNATHTGGPNSSFMMCLEKITPEQRETLDLSNLKVLFNGAEPVREATLRQFTENFKECGFRHEMHVPCYGLAEATLVVTSNKVNQVPTYLLADATALESGCVIPTDKSKPHRVFVGCGASLKSIDVKIVDPFSLKACDDKTIGEVWVHAPSNSDGYYLKDRDNADIFSARIDGKNDKPYLRTGDLGFIHNGELFISGRVKDLIIIRGKNYYPQDIEQVVETASEALAPGLGAAFSIEHENEEKLVIVHCLKRTHLKNIDEKLIFDSIRRVVTSEFGIKVHAIQLLMPASIPRTTSGKIQRRACKAGYLDESSLSVFKSWSSIENRVMELT